MTSQKREWSGFVDDAGNFSVDRRTEFLAWVGTTFRGKNVVVTVEPKRHKRSIDANNYWWAVPVHILAEHLGYTPNQMHYALLGECFGYRTGPTGQPVPNVSSSSELDRERFTKLIDWVLTFDPTKRRRVRTTR
jgi:hypothetical protein